MRRAPHPSLIPWSVYPVAVLLTFALGCSDRHDVTAPGDNRIGDKTDVHVQRHVHR
jgi:hypothetical protein